ncbi:MAG: S9 family peptidase [Alphaproteobacteria bacterium]|nr:S9 family peptidase [Alphaproteobacteria bacterium]
MFRMLAAVAGLCLAMIGAARAATLEDFASGPSTTEVSVSETGRFVALAGPGKTARDSVITVLDFSQGTPKGYAIPVSGYNAFNLAWKGDARLIAQVAKPDVPVTGVPADHPLYGQTATLLRTIAMNPDGSSPVVIFGDSNRLLDNAIMGQPIASLMVGDPDHIMMSAFDGSSVSLFKANVMTGETELVERGDRFGDQSGAKDRVRKAENHTLTVDWLVDPTGVAWARFDRDLRTDLVQIRARAKGDNAWRVVNKHYDTGDTSAAFVPVALTEDGQSFYAATRANADKYGLYEVRIADGAITRAIYTRPDVDIGGYAVNNVANHFALVNAYNGKLNGVVYAADARATHFLNANWGKAYQLLTEALPGQSIEIVSHARDFSRVAIKAGSSSTPDAYYLFDVTQSSMVPLTQAYGRLAGAPLGQTRTVTYTSADGTPIKAFLTLPPGGGKNLPLVVVPHGGPEWRDFVEFDPLFVQAFVSRGYAVIQPQFRGSYGFGKAFADAGRQHWHTAVLDDIEGAAKYAASQGIADPKRVCIFGWSFGGYAAIASAAFRPGTYACAVGGAGIYDLVAMLRWEREEKGDAAYDYWQDQIGKLTADNSGIDAQSAARNAAAIAIPVMLIHGDKDEVVPIAQSQIMEAAMQQAGKTADLVVLPGEGHHLERYSSRLKMLQSVIAFLDANIGR